MLRRVLNEQNGEVVLQSMAGDAEDASSRMNTVTVTWCDHHLLASLDTRCPQPASSSDSYLEMRVARCPSTRALDAPPTPFSAQMCVYSHLTNTQANNVSTFSFRIYIRNSPNNHDDEVVSEDAGDDDDWHLQAGVSGANEEHEGLRDLRGRERGRGSRNNTLATPRTASTPPPHEREFGR
ncbi:hypothetical protein HMN09_00318500 [Mycena chlorophos]|uniref:Uncharacterized protein n=1 Tax=Mycena chlorophos TaxID=658473 RepID=A0A8H6WIG4_MYCCL|nr:hypothetical protein HMN09_00318500 [Mycena chlorophos]